MDSSTIQGIALAIFGLGVIIADVYSQMSERKRNEEHRKIRQERRGLR